MILVKKKADLEIEREINTFCDLNHASCVMLEVTSEITGGQYYTIMASLIFSAFTFEAYLNHLGSKMIPFWNEINSIRVMDKYIVLTKHLSIKPDFGRRPYQIINNLFKFRNALAHGKSKVLSYTAKVETTVKIEDFVPREHWEDFCSLDNAEKVRSDLEEIIVELNVAAGEGNYPFTRGITKGHMIWE